MIIVKLYYSRHTKKYITNGICHFLWLLLLDSANYMSNFISLWLVIDVQNVISICFLKHVSKDWTEMFVPFFYCGGHIFVAMKVSCVSSDISLTGKLFFLLEFSDLKFMNNYWTKICPWQVCRFTSFDHCMSLEKFNLIFF